jgi:hypothetical protein
MRDATRNLQIPSRAIVDWLSRRTSYEHLSRARKELMNLLLRSCVDHIHRPPAIRARQARCRPEEAADKRTFPVNLATMLTQMRAAQLG